MFLIISSFVASCDDTARRKRRARWSWCMPSKNPERGTIVSTPDLLIKWIVMWRAWAAHAPRLPVSVEAKYCAGNATIAYRELREHRDCNVPASTVTRAVAWWSLASGCGACPESAERERA
jgi:hypothetical protein